MFPEGLWKSSLQEISSTLHVRVDYKRFLPGAALHKTNSNKDNDGAGKVCIFLTF